MSIPQVFEQNMSLVRYFRFCCCCGRLIYQSGSQVQSTPHCKFPPVWLTNFCHHNFSSGWVILCLPDIFSQWGGINCQLADNNLLRKKISWPLCRFSKFFCSYIDAGLGTKSVLVPCSLPSWKLFVLVDGDGATVERNSGHGQQRKLEKNKFLIWTAKKEKKMTSCEGKMSGGTLRRCKKREVTLDSLLENWPLGYVLKIMQLCTKNRYILFLLSSLFNV